jgi:hypothetical protein
MWAACQRGGVWVVLESQSYAVHRFDASDSPEATPDVRRRLLAAARYLIADGLLPSEIEIRIYRGLIAATSSAAVFRAGIGVDAPLSRDSASRLAEHAGRTLRGPRDQEFIFQYGLIQTRVRLMQAAHDAAEDLRRGGAPVTRDNLELAMMMTIGGRRGALILDNPLCDSIEKRMKFAASDFLEDAR